VRTCLLAVHIALSLPVQPGRTAPHRLHPVGCPRAQRLHGAAVQAGHLLLQLLHQELGGRLLPGPHRPHHGCGDPTSESSSCRQQSGCLPAICGTAEDHMAMHAKGDYACEMQPRTRYCQSVSSGVTTLAGCQRHELNGPEIHLFPCRRDPKDHGYLLWCARTVTRLPRLDAHPYVCMYAALMC